MPKHHTGIKSYAKGLAPLDSRRSANRSGSMGMIPTGLLPSKLGVVSLSTTCSFGFHQLVVTGNYHKFQFRDHTHQRLFVIVMGNEDKGCGTFGITLDDFRPVHGLFDMDPPFICL